MIVYIIRHGEIDNPRQYPLEHMPLSSLGRRQVDSAGARLVALGFRGKVFSSPFHRCLETANRICTLTGGPFVPAAGLSEMAFPWITRYTGLRLDEISTLYPHCHPEAELVWPWWPAAEETSADVEKRVSAFVDAVVLPLNEDVLLVGHGATTDAVFTHLTGDNRVDHEKASISAIRIKPTVDIQLRADQAHLR